MNASPLLEVSYRRPSSVAVSVPSHDPMPCLCTTAVLALRLTSLTRIVIAFGPGLSSMVFCTLSKPVAVSCTRLVPGSSLSSESGVLPTNWRSMNTDAPGTSDSSVSDASVGAAGAGAAGSGAAVLRRRPCAASSATGSAGVGTGSSFLGTMRGAAGAGAVRPRRLGRRCASAGRAAEDHDDGQRGDQNSSIH